MRLCVVGAGFAGLAAAVDLTRRGVDVLVLEARDRVGGRVWSQAVPTLHGEVVIERGAEFVLEGYDHLRRRVSEAGLQVADTGMSYYRRDVPGLGADQLQEAGAQLMRAAARAAPGTSAADVVAALDVPDPVAEALTARVEISCAAPAEQLDARVVAHVASFAPQPSHRIGGGNQALALAMARELGDRVHLERAVRAIVQDEHGVVVRTDAGDERVDRVVVAVPAPVAASLRLDPALPAATAEELRGRTYGHAAKLHVPLRERPATSALLAVAERFWCWTPTDARGEVGALVHAFAGSAPALAALAVETGPERWLQHLERLRPDLQLVPDDAVLTTWSDDPWAAGAYSAWPVGVDPEGATWSRPHGRVHLAGEYTAGEWSGLMEGALRSGARVAEEVLAADRTTTS